MDFNKESNRYGSYRVQENAEDKLMNLYNISDSNRPTTGITGTSSQLFEVFMENEFNYNDSFNALVNDLFAETKILPAYIKTEELKPFEVVKISREELKEDIFNNIEKYKGCDIFDTNALANKAREIVQEHIEDPIIIDVFKVLDNMEEYVNLKDFIRQDRLEDFLESSMCGTVEEICEAFMDDAFDVNDDFKAMLIDEYAEFGALPVEIMTEEAMPYVKTTLSKSELIKDILENPEKYSNCAIFDNEYLINEARNIARNTLENPKIFDVFAILNNKEQFFELENHIVITKLNNFLENTIELQKEAAIEKVSQNGWDIKSLSPELQADKDVALAAVKENGLVLEVVAYTFENDREVVLASINDYASGFNIKHASDELLNDKSFIMDAVKISGLALLYASDRLKDDKDIVLQAVKTDPSALKYASLNMRDNIEVVKEAIKGHKDAIWYASSGIQKALTKQPSLEDKLKEAQSRRNDSHDRGPKNPSRDDLQK